MEGWGEAVRCGFWAAEGDGEDDGAGEGSGRAMRSGRKRRSGESEREAVVERLKKRENLLLQDQHDHLLRPPTGVIVLLGSGFLSHTTRS
jgi:hypothetical protein